VLWFVPDIPAIWEAEIRGLQFQANQLKKVFETPISMEEAGCSGISIKKEDHSQGWPKQKARSYLQNNQSKKG
jgi:hypothetical protein